MPCSPPPTTVTQLTPDGRGAVATLLVSGPASAELVDRYFTSAAGKPVWQLGLNVVSFGQWRQPTGLAEDVVVARRSDSDIEVSCHGGIAAASAIIGSLQAAGATRIDSTGWIAEVMGGRLEADAWMALSRAKTERAAGILLDQLRGSLRRAVGQVLSHLQAGDLQSVRAQLGNLIACGSVGLHLTTPWRIAVAGEPNVGKSSLVNRLVGYDRSIVFDQPGTTRDVLGAATAFDGWPVDLQDTAGLRAGADDSEQEGIRRARQASDSADLTILVVDAQLGLDQLDSPLASDSPDAIIVANKQDLASVQNWPEDVVRTSAITGAGVESLIRRIAARLVPDPPRRDDPVPWTDGQLVALSQGLSALDESDLAGCQHCLRSMLDCR